MESAATARASRSNRARADPDCSSTLLGQDFDGHVAAEARIACP